MTQQKPINWAMIADMPEQGREAELVAFFNGIASLSEDSRRGVLKDMIQASIVLPPEKEKGLTKSRMKSWVKMDREKAKGVAASYEAVMNKMPGDVAFKRISAVRAIAKDLSPEEVDVIRILQPGVLDAEEKFLNVSRGVQSEKKSRWAFWKK